MKKQKICYTWSLMTEQQTWISLFIKKFSELLPEGIALFCVLLLVRGYEIIMAYTNHVLPNGAALWFINGLLVDITFASMIVFILLLVCTLLSFIHNKVDRYIFLLMGIFLLISYISVSEYFAYTLLPAGRNIFGYTGTELSDTIATAISPSFGVIFPFVFFLVVFGWGIWQFNRWEVGSKHSFKIIGALSVLAIAFWIINPSEANYQKEIRYYITANKAEILLSSMASEVSEAAQTRQKWQGKEYPLLKTSNYKDVLGPYFKKSDQKPNIVFIIVEGLGRAFAGPGAQYGGFTPFLDSLSQKGLWFKNVLSGSGRSFGLHPTILGSLPFAQKGFMELGADMPEHRTLISLLNKNGYQSDYFCGYNSHFDNIDVFLERQQIDYIMDESDFDSTYKKMDSIKGGFTWGYGDKALFEESLKKLDQRGNRQPRVDMYFTLNTHEPFIIPNEKEYLQRVDHRLAHMKVDDQKKEIFTNYKKIFASLLYSDDAIRKFIQNYKKRPEYDHTIFIITGDHRMGPIPHASKIDRFRVFFTIYSPMLKS
ncbi:MAG TPA: sulfatase-like hydrolase/transferase, partial [Balneolaceae bacterium]|nr:sulfatase-like hydrolase/transferase [Balneolaceae bacterium]